MKPDPRQIEPTDIFPATFLAASGRFFPCTMMSYAFDGAAPDEVLIEASKTIHAKVHDWITAQIVEHDCHCAWVRVVGDQVMQDHPWLLVRFTQPAVQAAFTQDFKDYLR
ncbi:hypothetical protein HOU03_gp109 [Caulobacter phage CcrSC]|uniref:Uncharacterized protein n=1 Tax=Caulobacter phage CcrSC TaxID=2283272 RepID=A0A385ECU2_9CAUD|nr:hypothetical protein HOU03_gp109 [Caulobacter phage CcrSC]AXQ69691.1 hypothetical protein CcrSC_gp109 [Caulobacter phage CcrSC]